MRCSPPSAALFAIDETLFLHGPPAVGKLTIAREVAALIGWRLFHNHLTVNLALAVYDCGTPGFIALREQIWSTVFRRALATVSRD